jgi:hypothetical protein
MIGISDIRKYAAHTSTVCLALRYGLHPGLYVQIALRTTSTRFVREAYGSSATVKHPFYSIGLRCVTRKQAAGRYCNGCCFLLCCYCRSHQHEHHDYLFHFASSLVHLSERVIHARNLRRTGVCALFDVYMLYTLICIYIVEPLYLGWLSIISSRNGRKGWADHASSFLAAQRSTAGSQGPQGPHKGQST